MIAVRHTLFLAAIAATSLPAQVTFSKDVAPVIYRRCSGCHRPGEAAPFSLLSYDDVRKRGQLIATVTVARIMPPWKAEPASYEYRDSRRLSDAELATIQTWVKSGMPEGDRAKEPAPPQFASDWQLGPPDLVVTMEKGFAVPADGADIYRYFRIPLNLPEDKWVRAIELRPSARTVVHHVLYFADGTEDAKRIEAEEDASTSRMSGMKLNKSMTPLGGIAVGGQPHLLPEGLALKLPKGSDLMFQYHFHPVGKAETERSTIGLYFAKEAPAHTLINVQLPVAYGLFSGLDIAPGQKDFVARDSFVLPVDVEAISIGAHAHYIGKTMKMTATFADGTVKTLLDIKDWDFAWQDRYYFANKIPLPKGTRLDSEITWDNSAENVKNPMRPPVEVKWGEQTRDEMGGVGLMVYAAQESGYETLSTIYREHVRDRAREAIQKDPSVRTTLRDLDGN